MLCEIAELLVEVPEAGGLAPLCKEYLTCGEVNPDIMIREEEYRYHLYPELSKKEVVYMESGAFFSFRLLDYNGFYLHASAVTLDGKAYLFSGPCGMGKSTHTRMWQQAFGPAAQVFNDDKPALRCIDGVWYAYGTPWCGKDGININMKVPVAGVCFLKQAPENKIRRLSKAEALQKIMGQTFHQFKKVERLDQMLTVVSGFLETVPVFELENRPEITAAQLSHNTMRTTAEEIGL